MTRSKPTIATLFSLATSAAFAQYTPPDPSGFEGIIVETYYVSDSADASDTDGSVDLAPGGETTYRVFVDLLPGYELLTIGGFVDHDISFQTTTSFYHNDDRGEAWAADINDIHLYKNTVAIDSWLSMGAASDDHWGVLKSEDPDGGTPTPLYPNDGGSLGVADTLMHNYVPAMGIPLTTADGLFATGTPPPSTTSVGTAPTAFNMPGGNSFVSQDFAWAVLGGVKGPTAENKILIGQFTTDGTLTFCLNLWVKIPDSLVCTDPNCHEILEFYGTLLPNDTAGGGIPSQNKFTHPSLCFDSSTLQVDCQGVPGGSAIPGTPCDDGNAYTTGDEYAVNCDCLGHDCDGVLGGNALPGAPCDDGNSATDNDTLDTSCNCAGIPTTVEERASAIATVNVHPNPVRDLLWVDVSGSKGSLMIELSDMLGERIISRDLGKFSGNWTGSLDLGPLSKGVYFLRVTVDGAAHVERITRY